jgi:uncharacterized repeat protein (TIGR01451 family)
MLTAALLSALCGSAQLFSAQKIITFQVSSPSSVDCADLNGDGDMDVLYTSTNNDKIAWNENLGEGIFGAQQIISTLTDAPMDVYTADLNGDGDMDVLSASWNDNEIAWYENLGGGLFGIQQIITSQAVRAVCVHADDMDGDGDLDVLSTSTGDSKIAWYENLGGGNFGSEQIISLQAELAEDVYAADLDGDNDIDVLSASLSDDKIAWYENLNGGNFSSQHIITTNISGARSVHAADLDNDFDMDVISVGQQTSPRIAWHENLTGEGCLDLNACNYNADAWIDNGSCCYISCGCTNPLAVNYLESANCDDGTCEFVITGTVFFDENEDGVMNENDYGLPFQSVTMVGSSQIYMTNDEGNFIANIGQLQLVEFSHEASIAFPFNTTPNPVSFNAQTAESTEILFGISTEITDFAVLTNLYPDGFGFLCNSPTNYKMSFRNMGNLPIDGVVELEYDELFQGHQEVTPIDSANGNIVYMSFENLLPGQMFMQDIKLLTPTVDHIGEYVTSSVKIYGYSAGEQVAYGEKELTMEIICAYDPNDKQAFPLGYTNDHLLLQETEQEFVIRFQNTGNAPAQNIRIQDTLDVNFDISTFKIISNSHSVMSVIDLESKPFASAPF